MIIVKEVDPILHKQKCLACGYYTIYSAVPSGDKAIDTCTHCGHAVELVWYPDLRAALKSSERMLRDLTELFPELAELKNPGDHILLD
jgi:Na+-translocating ferredoxin:NAD+ oxidoreductase RNF subunit RnfB